MKDQLQCIPTPFMWHGRGHGALSERLNARGAAAAFAHDHSFVDDLDTNSEETGAFGSGFYPLPMHSFESEELLIEVTAGATYRWEDLSNSPLNSLTNGSQTYIGEDGPVIFVAETNILSVIHGYGLDPFVFGQMVVPAVDHGSVANIQQRPDAERIAVQWDDPDFTWDFTILLQQPPAEKAAASADAGAFAWDYTVLTAPTQSERAGSLTGAVVVNSGYDPEVDDWKARVIANSGTVSNGTLIAVNDFMVSMKAAGLRTKFLRLNLFCGDQIAAALVPLIKDAGNALDSAYNNLTYSESSGIAAANVSSDEHIETGLVPSVSLSALTNDVHLSIYMRGSNSSSEPCIPIGCAPTDGFFLTTSYSGLGQVSNIWTGTGRPVHADSQGNGHYVGSRTSSASNGLSQYRNGASTGSSTSVGGSPSTYTVSVNVLNVNPGASGGAKTLRPCAAYSIGKGLTSSEVSAFYTALQAFQTALGRQV